MHLAADAYKEMAEALLEVDSDKESEARSDNLSATLASGHKRKRPEAVITTHMLSANKRG